MIKWKQHKIKLYLGFHHFITNPTEFSWFQAQAKNDRAARNRTSQK